MQQGLDIGGIAAHRLAEMGLGLPRVAEFEVGLTQIVMGKRIVRLKTQRFLIGLDGGGELRPLSQSRSQVDVGSGEIRLQPRSLLEVFDRVVHFALFNQGVSQVVVSFNQSRLQAHRLAVMNRGLFESPQGGEDIAQVETALDIFGLPRQTTLQAIHRFRQTPLSLHRVREIEECRPQVRLQMDGLPIVHNRIVQAAGMEVDVPEREMRGHEIRAHAEGLPQMIRRLVRQAQVPAGTAQVINEVGVVGQERQRAPKVGQPLIESLLLSTDHAQ